MPHRITGEPQLCTPDPEEPLYEAGATLVELSERFSVHRRTVAAHLFRRSVPIRTRGLDERRLAEAVELYVEDLTLMEVGQRSGDSQQAVRRALATQGSQSVQADIVFE